MLGGVHIGGSTTGVENPAGHSCPAAGLEPEPEQDSVKASGEETYLKVAGLLSFVEALMGESIFLSFPTRSCARLPSSWPVESFSHHII